MTDYARIYDTMPEAYDRMVQAEDVDGHLAACLERLVPMSDRTAVEIGVGTGRVTEILLTRGCHVLGFEPATAMLARARARLAEHGDACTLAEADGRSLPIEDDRGDFAIAGWVFGHLRSWEPEWRDEIGRALDEMQRVTRPSGTLIIAETLGTGTDRAGPPNEALADYYAWLERDRGFSRECIQTDYQFPDVEAAVRGMEFFFGPELGTRIRQRGWARVPEWTGIWHRRA